MPVRARALLALPGNMKLQRDIFVVAIVCHLQSRAEADKPADNEFPETYDKNLIQVVDDSVISRLLKGVGWAIKMTVP